jgi:hypothetical protein
MISKKNFYYLLVIFLFFACKSDPLNVDASKIDVNLNYINLDSILVNTPEDQIIQRIQNIQLGNAEIIDYQLGYCLGVGKLSDSSTAKNIQLFTKDPYIKRVEKHIQQKFYPLTKQKEEITAGFKHLKYHFPTVKLPEHVVFMNSFFASNVFCTEKEIGIGLERYLGEKTDVIQELPSHEIFQWVKEGMDPTYLERDVLTAWIMTHLVPEDNENTISAIIRWGKIIYFTEAAFPKKAKNVILRYNEEDYQWAMDNEYAFWKYLADEKLLFSNSDRDRNNFLSEGPFTIGLPEKGPDRLGQFLGWKMIHSYMKSNKNTSLEELLKTPYNTILQAYDVK